MAIQMYLFKALEPVEFTHVETDKKRVRKDIPTYKKVYSVYQYDREKYMRIWSKLRKLAIRLGNPSIFFRVNPYAVLNHCYLRENNKLKHLGDERHIFRLRSLNEIQKAVYGYAKEPCNMTFVKELSWNRHGVIFYYHFEEGGTAEIDGTQLVPVKERLKKHIKLLRALRKGCSLQKAVKESDERGF